MGTITLKNIPNWLHKRLKKMAARHRRSLNSEILVCLEASAGGNPIDTETFLKKAEILRGEVGGILTDKRLRKLKEQGRP